MEKAAAPEMEGRVRKLQENLASEGVGLALIRQAADLFYYTGTLVDGFLAVKPQAPPLLLVRRPQSRMAAAPPPFSVAFYKDLKDLPTLLSQAGLAPQGGLGLEMDVLSAAFFTRLQQLFPQEPIRDISPLIRRQRMIKSAFELAQLRRAAAIIDRAYEDVPGILRPGLSELELSAALEYRLRVLGHQGLIRVRNWDLELFYGHVLSGVSGLVPPYADTPSGGAGFSPAFPQGPSLKKLAPGEPISIDLVACVNGYSVDMTRIYALGELPEPAWEAFQTVEELYRLLAAAARPGVEPGKLFHRLWDEVRGRGLQKFFMGPGAERVGFLGHGVGLELDEYPFLSPRFPYPLEADMVMAFEPKFFLPEIGMVGQEDTGRITDAGMEWLTQTPRGITIV